MKLYNDFQTYVPQEGIETIWVDMYVMATFKEIELIENTTSEYGIQNNWEVCTAQIKRNFKNGNYIRLHGIQHNENNYEKCVFLLLGLEGI